MGVGNQGGGGNSGNKRSNHNFEHRELLLLGEQLAALGLLATESTLISVLNAIVAHQDMEILLVRDTGNADQIVQQIREYDETTQTWITSYQDVSGATYVPVGPLEYLDPSAVLNLILAELIDQGVTLDDIQLNTADVATETTLTSVDTRLTPQVRTHNTISSTGIGTVPAGSLRGSVLNSGAASGTWNGITLTAGLGISWEPVGNRDTYAVINFNATGTTFTIEYTT